MNIRVFDVQKEKGFRINVMDTVFIALLISISVGIYFYIGTLGYLFLLPLYIGFSFFLFCNVFRLRTIDEIVWTLLFLSSVRITFEYFPDSWVLYTMGISFLIQVLLIVFHVGSKGYRT